MAHHFIIAPEQIGVGEIAITGNDFEHLTRVLRLKPGAEITVADGQGQVYYCILKLMIKGKAVAEIQSVQMDQSEPPVKVVLLQGLPKGDKLEFIIQKATELGVAQVIPVAMTRSVVHLSESKAKERVKRWQRIAYEAAKQCRRGRIPEIGSLAAFDKALHHLSRDTLILLPWEEEHSKGLKEMLTAPKLAKAKEIAIVIGPEGGLEEKEVALAKDLGAIPLSLGPRILRTETAALAALTMVMYQLGDLGGLRFGN